MEITHKIRTSFKTLASKKAATSRLKNLRVTINFMKSNVLHLSHATKSIRINSIVASIAYTLEKKGFAAATLYVHYFGLVWFV